MEHLKIEVDLDEVYDLVTVKNNVHDLVGNLFIHAEKPYHDFIYMLCRVNYGKSGGHDNGLRMISLGGNRWSDKQIDSEAIKEFIDITDHVELVVKKR